MRKYLNRQYRTFHLINRMDSIAPGWKNYEKWSVDDVRQDIISGFSRKKLNLSGIKNDLVEHLLYSDFSDFCRCLESYELRYFGVSEWLGLSSLAIGLKQFHKAVVFRSKALDLIEKLQHSAQNWLYTDQIISKCIEQKDPEGLKTFLRKAQLLKTLCGTSLYSGIIQKSLEGESFSDHLDSGYYQLISGKRVAVIGPLSLSDQETNELDNHDLIVRLNNLDFFSNSSDDPSIFSDIIYLPERIITGDYPGIGKSLVEFNTTSKINFTPKFIVGKREAIHKTDFNLCPVRSMIDTNPFTLNGGLSFLQRVVVDLLLHNPETIKIYGVDMYTSLNYNKNYIGMGKRVDNDWEHAFKTFVHHDIISNFKAMVMLYESGRVTGTEKLNSLVSGGLHAYLDFFEAFPKTSPESIS